MKLEVIKAPSTQKAMMEIYQKFGPDAFIYRTREGLNGVEVLVGLPGSLSPNSEMESMIPQHTEEDHILPFPLYEELQQLGTTNMVETQLASLNQAVRNLGCQLEYLTFKYGANDAQNPLHSAKDQYLYHLEKMGFSRKFCEEVFNIKSLEKTPGNKITRSTIIKELAKSLKVSSGELIREKGIFALVGPTGVGKTTSIVKLAKKYVRQFEVNSLGIITTDPGDTTIKSQLLYYCNQHKVDLEYAINAEELTLCLEKFKGKRLILIDTQGVSQRNIFELQGLMNLFDMPAHNINIYLTLPCNAQEAVLDEIANVFSFKNIKGCILTKQDEAVTMAPALSVSLRYKMPIAYVCNGQDVNKHIVLAETRKLIDQLCQVYPDNQAKNDNSMFSYFKKFYAQIN